MDGDRVSLSSGVANRLADARHAKQDALAQEIHRILSNYDPLDAEGFSAAIQACLELNLSHAQLAERFRVSHATISRWASSRPPNLAMRQFVVESILRLLEERWLAPAG
ncbi:MAG: hypothetical protein U1E87_05440 [Alphaproteobacteria bacterium]